LSQRLQRITVLSQLEFPATYSPRTFGHACSYRYQSHAHSIVSEPADTITIHDDGYAHDKNWHAYTLQGKQWGRARLVITYDDGTTQSIGYRTIKPEAEAVADMGRFLFHQQWHTDTTDPFHRASSVISYDNEAGKQYCRSRASGSLVSATRLAPVHGLPPP
jgi:hypothetical protein